MASVGRLRRRHSGLSVASGVAIVVVGERQGSTHSAQVGAAEPTTRAAQLATQLDIADARLVPHRCSQRAVATGAEDDLGHGVTTSSARSAAKVDNGMTT